ncbi:hypothetical protein M9458_030284, partial [Cirrhinus mrigala]
MGMPSAQACSESCVNSPIEKRDVMGGYKACAPEPPELLSFSKALCVCLSKKIKASHVTGSVFLPAHVTSRAGIHTACAWERITQRRLSSLVFLAGLDPVEPLPHSLPPGNAVELGSSPPLRGSLEQLVRLVPAGAPFHDTELAVQRNPEASLERLVPLVDYLAAWNLLPNVSAWVLHTVEQGYRIQFGALLVFPTLVGLEQGLVMEQEVDTLLRKEAIEVFLPHHRDSGFYSRYFIVPKKDGGLRPILDLRQLNRSVMRLKFRMLTVSQVVSQIRSEDWFVTVDLKDAYFHVFILSRHRKFLRFAFRGEAYQYRVLPFGLALSPRTFTKCVDAALAPLQLQGIRILNYIDDWLILAQSEQLGLRLNAKKSVLSPLQRTTYLGVVWDSTTMQARLSPAWIDSILATVVRVQEGRSLTVKQFQQLLGLMAAASNVIPFGVLYMRPLQWWLRTKGFSPRGNPFCMIKFMRRCLHALDMARCWELLVTA